MADKTKVPSALIDRLEKSGLTYKEMMDNYDVTRWGARKIGDHPDVKAETAGNKEKIYFLDEYSDDLANMKVPVQSEEVNHEEKTRTTTSAKQTITNEANTYLRGLEKEVKNTETPETPYEEPEHTGSGMTAIIHETDSHFSAHVKDRRGNTIYDTETARKATQDAFNFYFGQLMKHAGRVENIVLLLGGDLVEGENIYEGQAHKVEDKLDKQIRAARKTYFKEIKELKKIMQVPMKIVCVSGNHGDLPVSSSSNADDLIYSQLEDMIDISDLENIKFVRTDRSDGVTFNYRGWKGYLCHGENRSNHIGTSSPQSDWLAMKDQYGFDAAWRGHYHNQKIENINGAPVVMTNSRKPGDDYTDKLAVFGKTGNAIYFATDEEPLAEIKTETEVLPE